MSNTADNLFKLFPALYRARDAASPAGRPGPLESLLAVMAEQIGVLEEDLSQFYDNLFIETAADWAVPYIGDLIGYRTIRGVAPGVATPRAQVADTIRLRRRKGTAPVLEQLARDTTGWDARAVEFFQLLAATQHMNHVRPQCCYGPDLRQWRALEALNGPFETTPHLVDVRRIARSLGKYNIANVGIYLWRLRDYRLTRATPARLDGHRFTFNPLGLSVPLWTHPAVRRGDIEQLAEPVHVAAPISRRILRDDLPLYYGREKSLLLEVDGGEVPIDTLAVCDLSDLPDGTWAHPPTGRVAIDPVLGRIAFDAAQPPPDDVRVTFHYGAADDLGGGEYDRSAAIDPLATPVVPVADGQSIQDALDGVRPAGGVVEIIDSSSYPQPVALNADGGRRVELRAADGARPVLLLDRDLLLDGADGATLTLSGLVLSGGAVRTAPGAAGGLRLLRLLHCTLVPGIARTHAGEPTDPDRPSLVIDLPGVEVVVDRCILGAVRLHADSSLRITNSVIQAASPSAVAIGGTGATADGGAAGALVIENCTVVGRVHTRLLTLASDSIFRAEPPDADPQARPIFAERKQQGCVRFCFVPPGSRVPRRYRCQPDLALDAEANALGLHSSHDLEPATADAVAATVLPRFTSMRYGDPGYLQLGRRCHPGITRGAHDGSEMGVYHDLQQPARESDLRVRLDEYLRLGLEAGIFYVT